MVNMSDAISTIHVQFPDSKMRKIIFSAPLFFLTSIILFLSKNMKVELYPSSALIIMAIMFLLFLSLSLYVFLKTCFTHFEIGVFHDSIKIKRINPLWSSSEVFMKYENDRAEAKVRNSPTPLLDNSFLGFGNYCLCLSSNRSSRILIRGLLKSEAVRCSDLLNSKMS